MWSFLIRPYPNANVALLHGSRPILIDSGHATDTDALLGWLYQHGGTPRRLACVVNTHAHSDHIGGNAALQTAGVPVAAEREDAALVNARDPRACDALWLGQAIPAYSVDRALDADDIIDTGTHCWQVIPTPGHTARHISLLCRDAGLIVLGDLLHGDDQGWLPPPAHMPDAMDAAEDSLRRVAAFGQLSGISGHGRPIADTHTAAHAALARLARWRQEPERAAWHASKRIFAHALLEAGGMTEIEAHRLLRIVPWLRDFAAWFGRTPEDMAAPLIAEVVRSGAAGWIGDRLLATTPPLPAGWNAGLRPPAQWG